MSLEFLGWNDFWNARFTDWREQGHEPARVVGLDRERCTLLDSERREWVGELAGRLRHEARSNADFPAVGDWVAIEPAAHDGPRRIAGIVPRRTSIARGDADKAPTEQVLAANVDTAFLVSGLDLDFNVRRIERYLATVWEGGVLPVIVLNKADLADDLDQRIAEAEAVAAGAPVIALTAAEGRGLEALEPWLGAGRTVALLGSSGVGKSTIANRLLGAELQATQQVRAHDSRGRHTTTRREMLPLPSGAWLIDTPGLRLLKLWTGEEAVAASFDDVEALAAECRFHDCGHESEPGCAVVAAITARTLEPARLESWRKLQREAARLARRQDPRLRSDEKTRWRAVSREMRRRTKQSPKR